MDEPDLRLTLMKHGKSWIVSRLKVVFLWMSALSLVDAHIIHQLCIVSSNFHSSFKTSLPQILFTVVAWSVWGLFLGFLEFTGLIFHFFSYIILSSMSSSWHGCRRLLSGFIATNASTIRSCRLWLVSHFHVRIHRPLTNLQVHLT